MNYIIFEDDQYNNFYPLSLTKPLWDLRSGIFSFRERFFRYISNFYSDFETLFLFTREKLLPLYQELYPGFPINDYSVFASDDDCLFLNATAYPVADTLNIEDNSIVFFNGEPLVAKVKGGMLKNASGSISEFLKTLDLKRIDTDDPASEYGLDKASYIWDLITNNKQMLGDDFISYEREESLSQNVTIIGDKSQISIDEDVVIDPYVVIDVTGGPVVIESGTVINSFTRIEGPAYIGENCIILGAKIREGSSIGDYCRIGGEVEESVFHGYSNKYHDGFIGHSYIGEWVNMGALTTNSDLKNNYMDVKVYLPKTRKNTRNSKVGCFIGDFVKTSIGTLINTGCSIGTGAMVVHSGSLTPYHIPPFSWYIKNEIEYREILEEFLQSAEAMMKRRNREFKEQHKDIIKGLFEKYNVP